MLGYMLGRRWVGRLVYFGMLYDNKKKMKLFESQNTGVPVDFHCRYCVVRYLKH